MDIYTGRSDEQNGNLLLSNHIVLFLTTDTSFLKTSTQVQTSVKGSMKMALEAVVQSG